MKFKDPSIHHIDNNSKKTLKNQKLISTRRKIVNNNKIDPEILRDKIKFSQQNRTPSPRKYMNEVSKRRLVNGDKVVPEPENVILQIEYGQ